MSEEHVECKAHALGVSQPFPKTRCGPIHSLWSSLCARSRHRPHLTSLSQQNKAPKCGSPSRRDSGSPVPTPQAQGSAPAVHENGWVWVK
ncbi:hypothetical protein PtA15_16A125 [Puccinia triticina]|uniref:Uncharacterized protein n=1 Tax=Puccinia triticina TaxID=208348 RepID=A0ABY7D3M4_9BASI|nr:uncharacterized protein PtA15_16A125 [Puccinia triticina]WAQ92219.1 hypothetical protein PtA15_16A125 [Puccinia triticina]